MPEIEDSITTLARLLETNMRLVKDDGSVGKVYVSKEWFDRELMKNYDAQVTVGLGGSVDRKIGFSASKRLRIDSPRVNVWIIEKSEAAEPGRRIREKMRQEINRLIREKRTRPNITKYTFWNLGQTSVTHKAYEAGAQSDLPPTDSGWSEISAAGYNKIWASDDDRHSKSVNVNLQHALLLFRFKIGAKSNVLTQIALSFEGYGTAPDGNGFLIEVWNNVAQVWQHAQASDAVAEDRTVTITLTLNLSNYVDENGYVWLFTRSYHPSNGVTPAVLYCDYVECVITVLGITYADVVSSRDEDRVDVKPVVWRTEFVLKTWLFENVTVT